MLKTPKVRRRLEKGTYDIHKPFSLPNIDVYFFKRGRTRPLKVDKGLEIRRRWRVLEGELAEVAAHVAAVRYTSKYLSNDPAAMIVYR